MRIALIGDVHLYTLEVHPKHLLSKRLFAHTNLLLNRRHRFNHALLPALVERVKWLEPGMTLFSGDVSTSSLKREFEDLLAVVKPLADSMECVLVPGNHDRYTFASRRSRRIETLLHEVMPDAFPYTYALQPGWTLLALDSAVPNRVFSRGALGREQCAKALEVIANVPADEALLVLCHYPCSLPPRVPSAWSHDLKEAVALRNALAECKGRVVFVHGHIHKPWHVLPGDPSRRTGKNRPLFECINAGSPCMTSDAYPLGQGFWELNLPDDPHAVLSSVHHIPAAPDGSESPDSPHAHDHVRWITRPGL